MSIRVVIADDEKYVLVVLKSALAQVNPPVEIVGEAQDGLEALRLCRSEKPDLLITDICMPKKDGLDLLAALRDELPQLQVIILSGYDNFSYAQEAIHYGVAEYLLKPVDEGKLEEAIRGVLLRRQNDRMRETLDIRNRILRRYLALPPGTGPALGRAEQAFLDGARECSVSVFCLVGSGDVREQAWYSRLLKLGAYCWDLDEPSGRLTVLTRGMPDGTLCRCADELWGEGRYLWGSEPLADDGRGPLRRRMDTLCQQVCRMERTLRDTLWNTAGDGEAGPGTTLEAAEIGRPYADRVAAAIRLGKRDYLESLLRSYWQELCRSGCTGGPMAVQRAAASFLRRQGELTQLPAERYEPALRQLSELDRPMAPEAAFARLLACANALADVLQTSAGGQEPDTRKVIEQFLRENYRSDVTLDQLAAHLHFNSSYTSDLFKRLFGKPFVAYLTAMRMEKAKELLASGCFKTYEVAEQVGYQDEKYFLKTFKRVVGCTPKAYKNRISG